MHAMLKKCFGWASTWRIVALICLMTALALLGAEMLLRAYPHIAGQRYVNFIWGNLPDRDLVQWYDPNLKMVFYHENVHVTRYMNGYTWDHQTDARGFRNPSGTTGSDMVLVGDSFVYGTGLDQGGTFAQLLREKGYDVYNLALIGDNPYSEMYRLSQYGLPLKPKHVLYFYYQNDQFELSWNLLSEEEMRTFIDQPFEEVSFERRPERPQSTGPASWIERMLEKTYVGKYLVSTAVWKIEDGKKQFRFDRGLNWAYLQKAILYMDNLSRKNGATFVIVPIILDDPCRISGKSVPCTDGRIFERAALKEFARENDIPFLDTRKMNNDGYYLVGDGHFNQEGHEKMAELLDAHLQGKEVTR